MTVDVEDYFQVSAFESVVKRSEWNDFERRVATNTDRLLDMFAEVDVRATFFVLGWVAEREPALVRRLAREGHEVASHGYDHRLVYEQTPGQFRDDVRRSKAILESLTGKAVFGYRAPSFSITERSLWALDVLAEEGFVYDASIFPVHHDRYGLPSAPRHAFPVHRSRDETRSSGLIEIPASTVRFMAMNLPVAGGGYFRLAPYWWTRRGIDWLNGRELKPAVFFIHPWEIDPEQPVQQGVRPLARLRHYRNLNLTESRLRKLLGNYRFGSLEATILAQFR